MNPALWYLLRLQIGGWGRYFRESVRTVRGAVLAVVGLCVFVPWLLAVIFARSEGGMTPAQVLEYGPTMLLAFCALNFLSDGHQRAIYFSPPEIQFLFPGPFLRSEVMWYKILLTLFVSLVPTILLSLVLRIQGGWWFAGMIGLILLTTFMQFFTLALSLISNAIGESLYARSRWILGSLAIVGLVLGGVLALTHRAELPGYAKALIGSTTWHVITWPLRGFFELMVAQSWGEMLLPFLLSIGAIAAVMSSLVLLESGYEEAAAAASGRIYARIQAMRGNAFAAADTAGSTQSSSGRQVAIPLLPYWGGIGPIAWRQLVTASRALGKVAVILLVIGISVAVPNFLDDGSSATLLPLMIGMSIWLSILFTTLVPFDFRGDIDRIGTLKTLPIPAWRIALGQLIAPTLLMTLIQWSVIALAMLLAFDKMDLLLVLAAYVPVFCFYLIALDNLLFLLFPVRLMANTPGDFQAVGRNVVLTIGKVFGLFIGMIPAIIGGVIGWVVFREMWAVVAFSLPLLLAVALGLIPLIALAFGWFDVGRDLPA
jgi:hypothetical protein